MVTSLLCHDEIKVCGMCVGWLMQRTGGIDVTPTLPVSDMGEAIRFYEAAGFDIERYDAGFAFVRSNDQSVFDLDFAADMDSATTTPGATSSLLTPTSGIADSAPRACRSRRSRTRRGECASSP